MSSTIRKMLFFSLLCHLGLLVTVPLPAQERREIERLRLEEYQPKTSDEAAIVSLLIRFEGAFNSHDLQRTTSFFAPDATYMPCGNAYAKYPVASKECQDFIKRNFGWFGFEKYYDPSISVTGDRAVVTLFAETRTFFANYTFLLMRTVRGWRVLETSYADDRAKGG